MKDCACYYLLNSTVPHTRKHTRLSVLAQTTRLQEVNQGLTRYTL